MKTKEKKAQKGWTSIGLPYGPIYDHSKGFESLDSFDKRGLNKPGTLIEVVTEKSKYHRKKQIFLIGDINPHRGVCDDCVMFDKDMIVTRYKVIELDK